METAPFTVCGPDERPPRPRKISTAEGLGDRMRTAAFAEKQAIAAFSWAAERFVAAPAGLRDAWRCQVPEEQEHYRLIMSRLAALGQAPDARPVSLGLWHACEACTSAGEFCILIAAAEEKGRLAGLRLVRALEHRDPATAAIFAKIAADELAHVALAATWYGWTPDTSVD